MIKTSGVRDFAIRNRRELTIVVGLAVLTTLFLHFFRAVELSGNSVDYAMRAQSDSVQEHFYAPHLLYIWVVHLFSSVLGVVPGCDVVCAGQAHSTLWAVISVVCMYLIVRRLTESGAIALTAAASLLVSNGFWVFATQLEVYAPVVGSFMLLAALLILATNAWPSPLHTICCAAVWALATLFHQANAMLAIPLVAFLAMNDGARGARKAATICALAGGAVIAAYAAVYLVLRPEQDLVGWVVNLANKPLTDWGLFANWSFAGLRQGLFSQVTSLLVLPDAIRPDQIGLQRRAAPLVLALLAWSVFRTVRGAEHREARVLLLLSFVTYFLFFTWWDPRVFKFYLPSAAPLIVLGAVMLHEALTAARGISERRGLSRWVLVRPIGAAVGLALAGTFVFNLVGSILPIRGNLGPPLGPHYYEGRTLESLAPNECVAYGFSHELINLHFYHNSLRRVREERTLYEAYYNLMEGEPGAAGEDLSQFFADEPCALISLKFLGERRFVFMTEGYMLSPDWQALVDWFFRVERQDDGVSITHDSFRIMPQEGRPPYFLVDRRVRVQSPREYIERTLVEQEELHEDLYPTLFPGRDRALIFGYSGNINTSVPASLGSSLVSFLRNSARVETPTPSN